ncbi:hypothetical protein [uncultured Akkermansia sp.]|uniref:hypothetical protein n=1 Tax=uncultured Akkermansia sp. TaxID=512294 RepID=UPI0025D5BD3D|nr:hypothetical protein [uncultured Akkermansia sp.]
MKELPGGNLQCLVYYKENLQLGFLIARKDGKELHDQLINLMKETGLPQTRPASPKYPRPLSVPSPSLLRQCTVPACHGWRTLNGARLSPGSAREGHAVGDNLSFSFQDQEMIFYSFQNDKFISIFH